MTDSVEDSKFTSGEFTLMVAVFLCFGVLLIGLCEFSRFLSAAFPVYLYGLALGAVVFIMWGVLVTEIEELHESFRKDGGEADFAMTLVGMILSAILFGLFCRELFLSVGVGFTGDDGTHRAKWIGFGFDNLFEAIFFDIPTIYDLHWANIVPVSFWTKLLLITFRVTLDVVLIKALFRHWDVWKEFKQHLQQTRTEKS